MPGEHELFEEDQLLPLSALQHLAFCERQCALIHLEGIWHDNPLTLEGSHLHTRTHESGLRREVRGDVVITRGLPLISQRLGVSGVADVVEFHREAGQVVRADCPEAPRVAVTLDRLRGQWRPFPVEYKRGKPKLDHCDEVQLCAQAYCLEEMLGVAIAAGALFYGSVHRRAEVEFTPSLRSQTEESAAALHRLFRAGRTPAVPPTSKCRSCSLEKVCVPKVCGHHRSAVGYLRESIWASLRDEGKKA